MEKTSTRVKVSKYTDSPNLKWRRINTGKQTAVGVTTLPLDTPVYPDRVRFVCISDTHSNTGQWPWQIPEGDVLIHGGDFCGTGTPQETEEFNEFLGELPHPHKVVIAGNHDLVFDPRCLTSSRIGRWLPECRRDAIDMFLEERGVTKIRHLLTNCTYLEDESTEVCGIKIYGSPWIPYFIGGAFSARRGQDLLDRWNLIPEDTQVLITHGPPLGYGDLTDSGENVGCVELLKTVQQRVKPKYHVFGHIHEGYNTSSDGTTVFINASTSRTSWNKYNPPVLFDLPLQAGKRKQG